MKHILAIDQGTTSSRAIAFDAAMRPVASAQREFAQHFPASGQVEHDPADIWDSVLATAREVVEGIGSEQFAAIGITNQRETTLIWDRATGAPIHNAIVWQDRRTAPLCAKLREAGHEPMITARTGLLIDPYFSATKVKWLLDNVEGARARAEAGELAFGTIDSFLIWKLTGGRVHATDATNAARTMLYDIGKGQWDADICALMGVPMALLPEVRDCADDFGSTDPALFGSELPIYGVAGDQQAATIGQACFQPGMMKSTYGTGCFALLNTGDDMVASKNRLLTTIAYRLDGRTTYALEGSIFIAGAAVQWLRDGLGILNEAQDAGRMARRADPQQEVYLVPAFTGLGAPHWDSESRGALYGLTRGTGPNEIARAALEAVGFQTADLIAAMRADWPGYTDAPLRVDGGMSASGYTMQFLADITGLQVDRPAVLETTALGVAWLAGMRAGLYPDQAGFAETWAADTRFRPNMGAHDQSAKLAGWSDAVRRTLSQRRA
ncbi:glycerol kinase GlpK [Maritimibacter fusiformis]|uniref:Glycerol kinase n=1 Tax=Maritimibacter fusiformis TaxID=2603819 RepID=A0A5D0RFX6_9RHOB|nr:glycerol kinase GlpK [Maritimibacter fusiformis]TYB80510.1 glycerol kinase GlpK [Maritimibacter fusiformis]